MFYVYRLVHIPTDRFYIGLAKNPLRRLGQHLADCHKSETKVYLFMRQTSHSDWRLELLSEWNVRADAAADELRIIRQTNAYDYGLNSPPGPRHQTARSAAPMLAHNQQHGTWHAGRSDVYSDETRRKMSDAKQGNTHAATFHADPEKHAKWLASMKQLGKSVICHETGEIYASVGDAAKALNVGRCDIRRVCNGQRPHVKRFTFSWNEQTTK